MSFEVFAIGSVAAALGVAHILLDTPIFESATDDGESNGDLVARDQADPDPSEIEMQDYEEDEI